MNIFKHEVRLYRKSMAIWIVSLVMVVVLFSGIYPSFSGGADVLESVLDNFPEGLRNALGLSSMNLTDPLGFYGFVFMYITLTGAVQAMNLGLSILSNELMDKTADFLLAKPIKRIKIVHEKLMAALSFIVVTNIVYFIASFIAMKFIADSAFDFKLLALFNISLFLIQLFFVSLGMFVSVFMNKMKTVVPISLGIVFAFFVINLLNESLDEKPLTALTPFAYFAPGPIYDNGGYTPVWFVLNLVLIAGFTTGAYIRYIKRDIPSV